jgi:hypothetical protein
MILNKPRRLLIMANKIDELQMQLEALSGEHMGKH